MLLQHIVQLKRPVTDICSSDIFDIGVQCEKVFPFVLVLTRMTFGIFKVFFLILEEP